jgi:hypothetical protein
LLGHAARRIGFPHIEPVYEWFRVQRETSKEAEFYHPTVLLSPQSAGRQRLQPARIRSPLGSWSACSTSLARHPERLGRQLAVIYDGATVSGQLERDPHVAREAKAMAATLLDADLTTRRATGRLNRRIGRAG